MQFVTILREYKIRGACADCGESSNAMVRAYNRFTESEVLLCLTCLDWHEEQSREQVRVGSWGAAFPRRKAM